MWSGAMFFGMEGCLHSAYQLVGINTYQLVSFMLGLLTMIRGER